MQTNPARSRPRVGATAARLLNVRPGEWPALAWSFLYFFCLLAAYYILRPLREDMGIVFGVERLQLLYTGTFVSMLLLVPVFGALASRLSRPRLLIGIYVCFLANILALYAAFRAGIATDVLAPVFYVWTSVFNLFVVSVFWSFMVDIFRPAQTKRLFGVIAAGGSAGAILGGALTASLIGPLGKTNLLLISASLLAVTILCIFKLLRWVHDTAPVASEAASERALGGTILAGIRAVARSRYLFGAFMVTLLYAVTNTFLYFEQAELIDRTLTDSAQRTRVFALIDLSVNVLTVMTQIFLTGRLATRFGLKVALVICPLITVVGFVFLGAYPILAVLVLVQVVRRASAFAIMKPSQDMLFAVVEKEDKYKAKNFIDTAVYRGGDLATAWLYSGLRRLGLDAPTLAFLAAPLALIWFGFAFLTGRECDARRDARPPADDGRI